MATLNPHPPGTPEWTRWNFLHLTQGPGSQEAGQNVTSSTGIDINNHNAGFQIARYLLPAMFPNLLDQQLFFNDISPIGRQAASTAITELQDPNRMVAGYRAKANAASGSALQNLMQRLRSGGAGIGAEQGAAINASNQAASAGNRFQAQQASPEGTMNRMQGLMALIQSQNPNLANLMNLNNITQGTARGNSGLGGLMGAVGQIGSMATGGGMGGFNLNNFLQNGGGAFTQKNNWQNMFAGMGS